MSKPFRIGLTGSIGMGKSTTALMFAEHSDVALWDADAAVHRLYGPSGAATKSLREEFSEAVGPNGTDRSVLKSIIAADPDALRRIEAIVHPLVQRDREDFLAQ
ncbi:MAG: dephospho-CoA kinase, partial [Pseudomonadota bacterium]